MKRSNLAAATLIAALGLLSSCASLGDPFLVAFSVSDREKAAALVRTGIEMYKTEIVARGELSSIRKAVALFQAALRYDPSNAEAPRYLILVDDYRAREYEKTMDAARALAKKRGKGEEDEYAMHAAIRRAVSLDPGSKEAAELLKETSEGRTALVNTYLGRADKATAGLSPSATEGTREKVYIEAFRLVLRAKEIEPRSVEATKAYYDLKSEISDIVKRRIAGLDALYAKGSFEEARAQIGVLDELDRKLDGTFSGELVQARYRLYFNWAKYHETRKEWAQAAAKATVAVGIRRTAEAQAVLKRVGDLGAAEERGATFEAGIKNIDMYIDRGDLVAAQRIIASLSKTTTAAAQKALLEERRHRIRDALAAVYARGVQAYREERFKDAIAALEVVVAIDTSYEDASGFLDKAKAKQAVLDQY